MEACGTAHHWGRVAQDYGHEVTLVPPVYVRPFVRRNKTDQANAEALVDAARSARIPSVPVKRVEQQALETRIAAVDRQLRDCAAAGLVREQLQTVPGIGTLTATALVGAVGGGSSDASGSVATATLSVYDWRRWGSDLPMTTWSAIAGSTDA